MSVHSKLRARAGKPPADQRKMWCGECATEKSTFRTMTPSGSFTMLSFNMYYGQVNTRNGNPKRGKAIDVSEYEILFTRGIHVICLQEVVLGPLPEERLSSEGHTEASYRSRGGHWERWTRLYPNSLFTESYKLLLSMADRHGYDAYECGAVPSSMYRQGFGNVTFVHRSVPVGTPRCVRNAMGRLSRYQPPEQENRSIVSLEVEAPCFEGRVRIANTHFSEKPSKVRGGETSHEIMARRVVRHLNASPRCVVVGDFNKSDPHTTPESYMAHYTVAFDKDSDSRLYKVFRGAGYSQVRGDYASAWNARQPDQVLWRGVKAPRVTQVFPWNGRYVLSDHSAFLLEWN